MLCTWIPTCTELGQHPVEQETRPGLIVNDTVCDQHLEVALLRGYRMSQPVQLYNQRQR
jgi:hypothetical protein